MIQYLEGSYLAAGTDIAKQFNAKEEVSKADKIPQMTVW